MVESSPSSSRWQKLPSVLLIAIVEFLFPSIPDVFAVSAVCISWRQALATAHLPFSGPPLLLCSNKPPKNRNKLPIPSSMRLLKSLTPYPRPLESKLISARTLNKTCIGNSRGHLIFTNNRYVVVVDVFTGKEYQSPKFHCIYSCFFDVGILTEPPTTSSCVLLLAPRNDVGSCSEIVYWRLHSNAENWSVLQLDIIDQQIHSLRDFNGKVFGLLSDARVLVLDFDADGHMHCTLMAEIRLPVDAPSLLLDFNEGQSLVEWDGKLLLVRLVEVQGNVISGDADVFLPAKIIIYRLNLTEGSTLVTGVCLWMAEGDARMLAQTPQDGELKATVSTLPHIHLGIGLYCLWGMYSMPISFGFPLSNGLPLFGSFPVSFLRSGLHVHMNCLHCECC